MERRLAAVDGYSDDPHSESARLVGMERYAEHSKNVAGHGLGTVSNSESALDASHSAYQRAEEGCG